MSVRIIIGDAREKLRQLPEESVHCIVTSPPYWGLRDYGVDGQIGLETSPELFVAELVGLFREARRVLRSDGTLWMNLGDSYAANPKGHSGFATSTLTNRGAYQEQPSTPKYTKLVGTLKTKDLVGIPWMVAFALRADGWWLRQDIVWHKPNPMPESIGDRCTKAHEYLFLLSKSERYYFDQEAISEPASPNTNPRTKMPDGWDTGPGGHGGFHRHGRERGASRDRQPGVTPKSVDRSTGVRANNSFHASTMALVERRNKRSVWTVPTQGFREAHFATFPPALIEPCILAGCPEGGVVLDPFGGAGTTGLVADRLQRNAILIELNPDYAAMAERRIRADAPLLAEA